MAAIGDGRRRKSPAPGVLDALRAEATARAPALTAELADVARAATLDLLGDSNGAAAIAERRLRSAG